MTTTDALSMLRAQSGTFMSRKNNDDTDPWAMPLVLHLEKNVDISHEDALAATVGAVASLLMHEKATDEWREDIRVWTTQRIRKITRRARGSKWANVINNVPGVQFTVKDATVFAGVPHAISRTPAVILPLQIAALDLPCAEVNQKSNTLHALSAAINPDITLSTGKAMAQIGHVAQLALTQLEEDKVRAWAVSSFPIIWRSERFSSPAHRYVGIHDAGFTEIPAGTLTAKGWF